MKRKILCFFLVLCMALAMMPAMELPAQGANVGKNEYGHTVVYEPVEMLYTSDVHPEQHHRLMGFKLFDATTSQWSPKKEDQARIWLTNNHYLLNKFMKYDAIKTSDDFNKPFNYNDPTLLDGKIRPISNCIKKYNVYYNCYGLSWQDYKTYKTFSYSDAIRNMNSEKSGNIGSMLEKGDIEYLFSHRIKTVETSWWIFARSHDYGRSWIFDEYNNKSGNRWHDIHYHNGGPDIGGVNGWHPASQLTTLRFEAESNRDYTNDAYLSGAILVGRDIAGPRIKSVTVTSDRAGKNSIPNGAVTLDNMALLTDRTIYFQVEWDEPVLFSGLNNADLAQLSLKVQTIGKDSTSGMIAEAPFLNFTPKKTDSTQQMTFEYRIPDPYSDNSTVTQERGYYYRFSQVVVSANENESFWNNIRDIAGNKFASNSNGLQPAGRVQQTVSGAPFVDLEPFAIKNIKVSKEALNKEFVEKGELLSITMELNKSFSNSVFVTSEQDNYFKNGSHYENIPSITLNVKDSDGNYVTIAPGNPADVSSHMVKRVFNGSGWVDSSPAAYWQSPAKNQDGKSWPLSAVSINSYKMSTTPIYTTVKNSLIGIQKQMGMDYAYDVNSVTYNLQLYPGYTLDGDSIKVIDVSSPAGAKDASGYTLMNYEHSGGNLVPSNPPAAVAGKLSQYTKSPDRQYKLDFAPPVLDVALSDEGNGIIEVKADIIDASLWGADASFEIAVDGAINGNLQFQSSASGSYGDIWADGADNSLRLSFGSPIVVSGNSGQAYAFIKLPEHSEVKGINAVVTVADEARNSTRAEAALSSAEGGWSGFDTLAPKVSLAKKGENAEILITDMNAVTYSYAWTDEASGAPGEFTGYGTGNTGEIVAPDDLPTGGNTIYKRKLWVKAKDSAGNESQTISMDFSFDRTYTTVSHAVYQEGPFISTYPIVDVTIDNVKSYWYVWAEKPANFTGLNAKDYGDIVNYTEGNNFIDHFKQWAEENSWAADVDDEDDATPESNNSTPLTISLTANTPVVAVDEDISGSTPVGDHALFKWRFYGDEDYSIEASQTTRPIVLFIGGVRDDGTSLIEAVELDTFYSVPETKLRQVRFSTNDKNGNRQDNVRNINQMGSSKEGLFWADDNDFPVNIPNLCDIAEWEFYLAGDPVTGLDRINLEKTTVELVQIKHKNTEPTNSNDYSWLEDGTESSVREWSLDELDLTMINSGSYQQYKDGYSTIDGYGKIAGELVGEPCSPVYSFILNVDPQIITPALFEFTGYNAYNGLHEYQNIRYEFRLRTAYTNGEMSEPETLTHWVFSNNNANGLFYSIQDEDGHDIRHGENWDDPAPAPVPAFFDEAGNDITPNIPVVTFKSAAFDASPENAAVQFTASEYPYSYPMLYRAQTNTEGEDKSYLGSRLSVRWSIDPTMLNGLDEDSLYYLQLTDPDLPIGLAGFDEDGYSEPVSPGGFIENGSEVMLYYQFFDKVKLTESPIYVIRLRRDDTPPVIALSVSETHEQVRQVQVKVDSVYDIHTVTEGDTTRYVIDTPAEEIDFMAVGWRKVKPGESFNTTDNDRDDYLDPDDDFMTDEDNCEYVKVYPDRNGVFLFASNGYMLLDAWDCAGNNTRTLVVNGEVVENESPEMIVYPITNVDCEPPEFVGEPVWTQTDSEGKFTLSAEVDSTAGNAYLRFDKEYTEFLTDSDFDEHTESRTGDNPETDAVEDGYTVVIPASEVPMFALGSVPGQLEGALENGVISFTGYIRHDETVKAKSVTLVVTDRAGNRAERDYAFSPALGGVKPRITNAADSVDGANAAGLPVYHYGGVLEFTTPVTLPDYQTGIRLSHSNLPIYTDGVLTVGYTDLFGVSYSESIYANIFGPAFKHNLTFRLGDTEIAPTMPTNKDVTVKVDTSGTEGLTVQGSTSWQTTVEGNTSVTYTLTNSSLGKTQTFTLPITNIDKTAPTAFVSVGLTSATDEETGEVSIYGITYTIDGFDEADVTVIDEEFAKAPSSVTFDSSSQNKSYTFLFRDAAGNIGTYTVDATEIMFSNPADTRISGYKLGYTASGTDRTSLLGVYTSGGDDIDFGVVNSDIFVRVEALNANGEVVPSQMTRLGDTLDGVVTFDTQREILFTKESATEQVVTVKLRESKTNSEMAVPVTLPGGVIDKTAPIGTVNYMPQTDGSVKVYFIPLCSDLNETNGVGVQGEKSDGSPLTLESDDGGYYVNFDVNGSGSFILQDKAGNVGVVAIAVVNVDSAPPQKSAEGWSGAFEAKTAELIQRLLETPTNNPIKIFFSFNEHLSSTEVTAYDNQTDRNELTPTQAYVTAVTMGNTVTVEFYKNCQARIEVYDMRGNSTVLWRPEDGPITVIDRDLPELDGPPDEVLEENVMKITYTFKNGEEVILLSDSVGGYKNQHTAVFTENGSYILTFADRAGNVLSVYPTVTAIDELAPRVKMNMQLVGEGTEISGKAQSGELYFYTNRNVRIAISAEDETADGIIVTAAKQGGAEMMVSAETVTIDSKNYTHHFTVIENGLYEVIVRDKWGHENKIYPSVSMIDTTAPSIKLAGTRAVSVLRNTGEEAVKAAILQGVTAEDMQSGIGVDGVTVDVDISRVDLTAIGSYTAAITAKDRLGNTSEKTRTVNVTGAEVRVFIINGMQTEANDAYTMIPGSVTVDTSHASFKGEEISLYWAKGYKTTAQMKYEDSFDGAAGFTATEKGYYTILAQSAERGMYLVYVYVY